MSTNFSELVNLSSSHTPVKEQSSFISSSSGLIEAAEDDALRFGGKGSLTDISHVARLNRGFINGTGTRGPKSNLENLFQARKFSLGSNLILDESGSRDNSDGANLTGLNQCGQGFNYSSPSGSLHRFQLGSESGRRLGRSRWQSESILEVDTSEDVMSGDGSPQSRSERGCDSPKSVGLSPTWNPSSLRYVKVNLNQRNFQSFSSTSISGGLPQDRTIIPEATSTPRESPKKPAIIPRTSPKPRETPHHSTIIPVAETSTSASDMETLEKKLVSYNQRISVRNTPTLEREPSYNNKLNASSVEKNPSSYIPAVSGNFQNGDESRIKCQDNGLQLSSADGSFKEEMLERRCRAQSLIDLHGQRSIGNNLQHGSSKVILPLWNNQSEGTHLSMRSYEHAGSNWSKIDRTNSVLSTQSSWQNSQGSGEKGQTYIVRSTLCYNTSTQTDLVPYTVSTESGAARKIQEVGIEDAGNIYQTSQMITEINGRQLQDKSIQTAGSANFKNPVLNLGINNSLQEFHQIEVDIFRNCSSVQQTLPTSSYSQRNQAEHLSNELTNSISCKPGIKYRHHSPKDNTSNEPQSLTAIQVSSQSLTSETQTVSPHRNESPIPNYSHYNYPFSSSTAKIESNNRLNSYLDKSNFRQDDFSFKTRVSGFKHDHSSAFPDCVSPDKNIGTSLQYNSPNRSHNTNEKVQVFGTNISTADAVIFNRDISSSFLHSSLTTAEVRSYSPELNENIHDLSWTSGLGSEASSFYSYPKSSTSDLPHSRSISVASSVVTSSPPTDITPSHSPISKGATYQWKKVIIENPGRPRLDSDSVFVDDNASESEYFHNDDLNKTISSSTHFQLSEKPNNYQSNISNMNTNKEEDRYLGSFSKRDTRSHNVAMFSKFRDRLHSDSQTMEYVKEKRVAYASGITTSTVSESLADVISQANENLAKSAQRVCGIRRSNSSIIRNRLSSVDAARQERNRRETDWSRLRSTNATTYDHQDGIRWSSRRSLDSESIFRDLSTLASSTPRSSWAERRDRLNMLDALNQNTHVAVTGLIGHQAPASPRRHPPQPSRTDAEPPAIPPRMSRQKLQPPSEGNSAISQNSAKFLESSRHEVSSPTEKRSIQVTPLGKQLDEDIRVDNSKVNFKDLIMHWNSNSPGERNHSEELRKRQNKVPDSLQHNQQQQQPHTSVAPMITHPKPKVYFAATYKQEPVMRPELSSLSLSSPQSSSSPNIVSASSSASITLIPSLSTSQHHSSSAFLIGHPSNNFVSSEKLNSPTSPSEFFPKDFSRSIANSQTISRYQKTATLPTNTRIYGSNIPQSQLSDRASTLERPRTRSSSEMLLNHSQGDEDLTSTEVTSENQHPMLRERSSSQNDILHDKVQTSQLPQHLRHRFWVPSNGVVPTATQQPTQDIQNSVTVKSAIRNDNFGHSNNQGNAGTFISPKDNTQRESIHGFQRFEDNINIWCKNISSQDVEASNRFTSGSQTGISNTHRNIDDIDSILYQESKLGQQSWSSESALSQLDASLKPPSGLSIKAHNDKHAKENHPNITAKPAPVRPPRPSVQGRHAMGQALAVSKSSTSNVSKNGNIHPTASSLLLNNTSTPAVYVQEQTRSVIGQNIHLQGSSSKSTSPTHNPNQTIMQSRLQIHEVPNSSKTAHTFSEGILEDVVNTAPKPSPQRRMVLNTITNSSNAAPCRDTSYNTSPSSSNEISDNNSGTSSKPSPNREIQAQPPSRYYQREELIPLKSGIFSNSVEDLTRAHQDSTFTPRRQSCGGAAALPRGKSNSFSFSKRQPSMEELECDEKAKQLADELEDRDRRLSEALRQTANTKRMLYMDGLFSELGQVGFDESAQDRNQALTSRTSTSSNPVPGILKSSTLPRDYQTMFSTQEPNGGNDTSIFQGSDKLTNENTGLQKHKEELMDKLHKKLKVLTGEKLALQLEIDNNSLLGKRVTLVVDSKWSTENEREKFRTHLDDLEKIVRLLLNLSGQLARAEGAVTALGSDADAKVKKLTLDKRERLHAKHEEAKLLKEDIDKRSDQLLVMLQVRLSEQELADYNHLIKTKSTLAIKLQELEDEIVLAEHQLVALRRSLPDSGAV